MQKKRKKPPFRFKLFNIVLLVIIAKQNFAQAPSTYTPQAQWKTVTWRDKDILNQPGLSQANSGDEWWYSHKNLIIGGKHVGYIACGYIADFVHPGDETKMRTIFNEGSDSPYNLYPANVNPFLTGFNPNDYCMDFYDVMNVSNTTTPTQANSMRTEYRGIVSRLDLEGKMVWCRVTNISGEGLQELIVDGSDIYAIGSHEGVKNMSTSTRTVLSYNPLNASTKTSQILTGVTANAPVKHMYVIKLDIDGNKKWESLYGDKQYGGIGVSASSIYNSVSTGNDIIKNSDGFLYAVGQGSTNGHYAFIAKIDTKYGYLMSSSVIPLPSPNDISNSYNNGLLYYTPRSICEIGTTTKMALGGVGYFRGTQAVEKYKAFIYSINNNFSLNSDWPVNPVYIDPTTGGIASSNCWEINYHNSKQEVLVGLVNNCDECITTGNNRGEGQVLRLVGSNGSVASGINPCSMGSVNAYDLRVGVIETSDGGFAAISSRRPASFKPPAITLSELGVYNTCPSLTSYTKTGVYGEWDTDPLIVKFDTTGRKVWEWNEDVTPGRKRQLTPGDFKRQECMYKLSEAFDGGLVASGNSSFNHDDFYMVKLYSECGKGLSYDYSATPTASTISFGTFTISTSYSFSRKILVQYGQTLTVSGPTTVLRFGDSRQLGHACGIEVQPGGVLIVENGAVLTSIDNSVCPGSIWDGVEVLGNPFTIQSINHQGKVVVNTATISNARCGIVTGYQENKPAGHGGGIIDIYDATFLNNERDIEMYNYTLQNNISQIRKSRFIIDRKLNSQNNPVHRIFMDNILNPKLEGNEFKYLAGDAYEWDNRGWGIRSNLSSYTVKDYVASTNTTQNLFQDFTMGIEADNCRQSLRAVNVEHCNFVNNNYSQSGKNWSGGITLRSIRGAQLTRNNFNLQDQTSYGISVNDCQLYSISNNTLSGNNQLAVVGIYACNSGSGSHKIYRNYFNNLYGGIHSEYNNGNMADPLYSDGLLMNCNTFSNNNGDIAMLSDDNTTIPTVRKNQGSISNNDQFGLKLVRNKYSATCNTSGQWFIDYVNNIQTSSTTYNINHSTNLNGSLGHITKPACADPLVNVISNGATFNFAVQCPEEANVPQISTNAIINIQNALSVAKANTNNLQNQFNGKIDGGHTEIILAEIANPGNDERTLFDHLDFYDAYLSDAVLIAYFKRSTVPFAYIKSIHNNNKPVTEAVWKVIDGRGLSEEERNVLTAQQKENEISVRRMAENELGDAKSNLQDLCAQKINYFALDKTETARDSVLSLVNENTGGLFNQELMKLGALADKGDFSKAFSYADELSKKEDLVKTIVLEKALLELDTSTTGLNKIKTNYNLYNIVNAYSEAPLKPGHYKARAAMHHVYGTKIDLHYLLRPEYFEEKANNNNNTNAEDDTQPNNNNVQVRLAIMPAANANNLNTKADKNHIKFKMYPNPAKDLVRFQFSSRNPFDVIYIVMDLLGKRVMSGSLKPDIDLEINTQELKNGIYFVSLIQNNVVIGNEKLTIMK